MPAQAVSPSPPLTHAQVETFLRDGVLVVPVLTVEEIEKARQGLHSHLKAAAGVDVDNLEETAGALRQLSSTNGSGGVLDVFYPPFKLDLIQHPLIFAIMSQLWAATFGVFSEDKSACCQQLYRHRHGSFDAKRGFAYIDRVGFRVPSRIAALHADMPATTKQKKKRGKARLLQRSLTPHLDCCPDHLYDHMQGGKVVRKWRPLQAFAALSDTLHPDEGGFEAALGFHRDFDAWTHQRQKGHVNQATAFHGTPEIPTSQTIPPRPPSTGSLAAPCVGEFTPIRPREDNEVLRRITPVPCRAGDLVIWDNRIPHANSRENRPFEATTTLQQIQNEGHATGAFDSSIPTPSSQTEKYSYLESMNRERVREVVYLGFLPDVPLNRHFVADQLARFRAGLSPNDQWHEGQVSLSTQALNTSKLEQHFTELGRKLMGIDLWEDNEKKNDMVWKKDSHIEGPSTSNEIRAANGI